MASPLPNCALKSVVLVGGCESKLRIRVTGRAKGGAEKARAETDAAECAQVSSQLAVWESKELNEDDERGEGKMLTGVKRKRTLPANYREGVRVKSTNCVAYH